MRHSRRVIAIIIGYATWCLATATVAYAQLPPDPVGGASEDVSPTSPGIVIVDSVDTPLWQFIAVAALGALLAIAVVGLVSSMRHARASRPSGMLHA